MLKICENHGHIGKEGTQSSRRSYVEGLGGLFSLHLHGCFGVHSFFTDCFLQYAFKSEARPELCEAGRKMYFYFLNARFEVAFKNTSVSMKNILPRALSS